MLFLPAATRGLLQERQDSTLSQLGSACVLLAKEGAAPEGMKLRGRLHLSDSGWLLLSVPNALGKGAFDALEEVGVELPGGSAGYNAHVSVMSPRDVEAAGGPGKLSERGHSFSYQLGPVRVVEPEGWKEMARAYFLSVHSPELEKLRKSYGLSALPGDGTKPFHITFAVKRRSVTRPGPVITKQSASLLSDDVIGETRQYGKESAARTIPTVAVDLDGTLLEQGDWQGADHFSPLREGAREGMEALKEEGYRLIIWTVRGNTAAVAAHLKGEKVPFDFINENPDQPEDSSGKIIADFYIDDRGIDGRKPWPELVREAKARIEKRGADRQYLSTLGKEATGGDAACAGAAPGLSTGPAGLAAGGDTSPRSPRPAAGDESRPLKRPLLLPVKQAGAADWLKAFFTKARQVRPARAGVPVVPRIAFEHPLVPRADGVFVGHSYGAAAGTSYDESAAAISRLARGDIGYRHGADWAGLQVPRALAGDDLPRLMRAVIEGVDAPSLTAAQHSALEKHLLQRLRGFERWVPAHRQFHTVATVPESMSRLPAWLPGAPTVVPAVTRTVPRWGRIAGTVGATGGGSGAALLASFGSRGPSEPAPPAAPAADGALPPVPPVPGAPPAAPPADAIPPTLSPVPGAPGAPAAPAAPADEGALPPVPASDAPPDAPERPQSESAGRSLWPLLGGAAAIGAGGYGALRLIQWLRDRKKPKPTPPLQKLGELYRFSGKVQGVHLRKKLHELLDASGARGLAWNDAATGSVHATIDAAQPVQHQVLAQLDSYLRAKKAKHTFEEVPGAVRMNPVRLDAAGVANFYNRQGFTRREVPPDEMRRFVADRYRLQDEGGVLTGWLPHQAHRQLMGREPVYHEQLEDPENPFYRPGVAKQAGMLGSLGKGLGQLFGRGASAVSRVGGAAGRVGTALEGEAPLLGRARAVTGKGPSLLRSVAAHNPFADMAEDFGLPAPAAQAVPLPAGSALSHLTPLRAGPLYDAIPPAARGKSVVLGNVRPWSYGEGAPAGFVHADSGIGQLIDAPGPLSAHQLRGPIQKMVSENYRVPSYGFSMRPGTVPGGNLRAFGTMAGSPVSTMAHEADHALTGMARSGELPWKDGWYLRNRLAGHLQNSGLSLVRGAGSFLDELGAQYTGGGLRKALGYAFGGHPAYVQQLRGVSPAAARLFQGAGYVPAAMKVGLPAAGVGAGGAALWNHLGKEGAVKLAGVGSALLGLAGRLGSAGGAATRGLGTLGAATGRGLGTLGATTGRGLGALGSATGRGVSHLGSATGRGLNQLRGGGAAVELGAAAEGATAPLAAAPQAAAAAVRQPGVGGYLRELAGLQGDKTFGDRPLRSVFQGALTPFWDPAIKYKVPGTAKALRWGHRITTMAPLGIAARDMYNYPVEGSVDAARAAGIDDHGALTEVADQASKNRWGILGNTLTGDDALAKFNRSYMGGVFVNQARHGIHRFRQSHPGMAGAADVASLFSPAGWIRNALSYGLSKEQPPDYQGAMQRAGKELGERFRQDPDAVLNSPLLPAYRDIFLNQKVLDSGQLGEAVHDRLPVHGALGWSEWPQGMRWQWRRSVGDDHKSLPGLPLVQRWPGSVLDLHREIPVMVSGQLEPARTAQGLNSTLRQVAHLPEDVRMQTAVRLLNRLSGGGR